MASPIGYLIHPPDPPQPSSSSSQTAPGTTHTAHHPPPGPAGARPPLVVPQLAPVRIPSNLPASAAPSSASQPDSPASASPHPPGGHSKNPSLYQCADCLRRYSRPEHLQRHIATHTLGKRFTCDICSKAFSRADLLKRHRINHLDDNGAKRKRINSSSPAASRVAHACIACAKARVKCEELKPCTRCKSRGIDCEVASSEDAAMHLLHLSSHAQASGHLPPPQDAHDASYYPLSSNSAATRTQASMDMPPMVAQESNVSSAVAGCHTFKEEAQLPTPETSLDQNNTDTYRTAQSNDVTVDEDMARVPFSDFLRDVLYDQSLGNHVRLAEAQGLAVLDFCDDANLELKEFDFGLLDHWNFDPTAQGAAEIGAGGSADSLDMAAMRAALAKVWTESPWRWVPQKTDGCVFEHSNLPEFSKGSNYNQMHDDGTVVADRVVKDTLNGSARDKILAIALSTCRDNGTTNRVASSFPSTDAMDSWIHIFLASHLCQVSSFIHYGSFSLNTQWPEWLAMAAAAGAVLAPVPTLRRFGFALQEAVRVTIPGRFEENNKTIADIGLVQALVLVQDVGLWSGNRRKMEIAECHLSIPVAMMRYRGKFQRSAYPDIIVYPSDEGAVLEQKWKTWHQLESWKRLVFHAFHRDAQVSMCQLINPTMSYAELGLPLPCPKELWFARTAEEFKIRYLETRMGDGRRTPSLGDLLRDPNLLSANHHRLDVQFSIALYLNGFWSLIWEYRQLNSVFRPPPSPTFGKPGNAATTFTEYRQQELCKQLQTFQLVTRGWHEMLSAQEGLVLHSLFMNLHVSLNDLQLFSGKEGEEQARRVYPTLQRWSASHEARRALWHAGQIVRQAKMFPPGHLKDFYAIAVHHAALCLWTFGLVTRASQPRATGPAGGPYSNQQHNPHMSYPSGPTVYLDAEDSELVQNYTAYGHGRPAIRGPHGSGKESLLEDPHACIGIIHEVLKANFAGRPESVTPICENIILLLKRLGDAARAVGLG